MPFTDSLINIDKTFIFTHDWPSCRVFNLETEEKKLNTRKEGAM